MLIEPTTFVDVLVAVAVDTSQLNHLLEVVVAVVAAKEVVVLVVLVTVQSSASANAGGSGNRWKLWCEGSGRKMLAVELLVAKLVLAWWPSK